jgi:radical SAM protein with 4Fe4S-binding SPASM domain
LHSVKAFKALVRWASLGINDGKGIMFVSHTGSIYPSGFLPMPCGLFPEDDLVDVYQNSPLFQALRTPGRLQGKCAVCEYRAACGGSRSRAFAVTGNVLSQEPDCEYLPRVMREPSVSGADTFFAINWTQISDLYAGVTDGNHR